jgi:thiol-disulfide isomerase/thioredoxin
VPIKKDPCLYSKKSINIGLVYKFIKKLRTMKLRMLFYFIFISVLSSCSSLSEETPSISITSDKSTIQVGETVTFTVVDSEDVNITSQSVILIDGNSIAGSTFVPLQAKTYEATSSYESLVSNKIVITATLPSSFSKKAVVEDFTGTWCGWCPRLSYAASLVEEQTDKVFVVGVHNRDQMANSFGSALEQEYIITGFPTAYIDRANKWQGNQPFNIEQALEAAEGTVNVGLAIESSLTGSVLDFKVYQGFLENMTDVKLVVFVLEDGILAAQSNNTSYYEGARPIVDFEHNGVLRYAATDVMGDPTTSTAGVHEKSYSVDLSSYDVLVPENTGVLAMLVDDSGRVLYNAQYVIAGQNQDFD